MVEWTDWLLCWKRMRLTKALVGQKKQEILHQDFLQICLEKKLDQLSVWIEPHGAETVPKIGWNWWWIGFKTRLNLQVSWPMERITLENEGIHPELFYSEAGAVINDAGICLMMSNAGTESILARLTNVWQRSGDVDTLNDCGKSNCPMECDRPNVSLAKHCASISRCVYPCRDHVAMATRTKQTQLDCHDSVS